MTTEASSRVAFGSRRSRTRRATTRCSTGHGFSTSPHSWLWCYGYALEGPCPGFTPPSTATNNSSRCEDYLRRFGNVASPDGLKMEKGINNNSVLLMVLKRTFDETRWELLHEGASLLENCIQSTQERPL